MSGKWGDSEIPQRGWSCTEIHDLGAPSQTCEMCEAMTIRYVHVMEHPDYSGPLECGCICAGHMEEDLVSAKLREKTFKLSLQRRRRLLERTWNLSRSGNEYINLDGFNIVVFRRAGLWGARVEHRYRGVQMFTQWQSQTSDQAKLAAFDVMQQMRAAIEKHRPDEPHDWRGY